MNKKQEQRLEEESEIRLKISGVLWGIAEKSMSDGKEGLFIEEGEEELFEFIATQKQTSHQAGFDKGKGEERKKFYEMLKWFNVADDYIKKHCNTHERVAGYEIAVSHFLEQLKKLSQNEWLEEQKNDKRTPEERFKQEYVGEFVELSQKN